MNADLHPFAALTNVTMHEGTLDECRYALMHVSNVGITCLLIPPSHTSPKAVLVVDARHNATLKAAMRMAATSTSLKRRSTDR